jgi:hypothetical protein
MTNMRFRKMVTIANTSGVVRYPRFLFGNDECGNGQPGEGNESLL